jgi:chromosome segregation ATPase
MVMTDKPKTYAQQAADLKNELAQKELMINGLREQLSLVPELQQEVATLREKLSTQANADRTGSIGSKIQINDLEARAVAAEQESRNLRNELARQKAFSTGLEQQLEIAGAERDKNLGKQQKLDLLAEELKTSNLRVASLNQAYKELTDKATEQIAQAEKVVNHYRQLSDAQAKKLNEYDQLIKDAPDLLGNLKQIARR